jgi:hypothetical protein
VVELAFFYGNFFFDSQHAKFEKKIILVVKRQKICGETALKTAKNNLGHDLKIFQKH